MGAWPNQGTASSDNTNGGRQRPSYSAFCASCRRRRKTAEMRIETNQNSGACGYLVCGEDWRQGGCFEGPQPDLTKQPRADEVGPIDNIYY